MSNAVMMRMRAMEHQMRVAMAHEREVLTRALEEGSTREEEGRMREDRLQAQLLDARNDAQGRGLNAGVKREREE